MTAARLAFISGIAISLVMAASVFWQFSGIEGHFDRLPTWDPSAHGMDGIMLADAVKAFDPVAFFKAIYLMSYWPPVYPLIEMPAFLIFGYDYHVARDVVGVLYVLTVMAAFLAGYFLNVRARVLGGLFTAALVAASPYYKLYANLEMAEIPSALFFLLSLAAFFAYEQSKRRGALIAFCVSLSLLFFTKYNNALLVFIALFVFHAWFDRAGRSAVLAEARRFVASGTWRQPFYLFAGAYLLGLAGVFLAGGVSFDAFGQKVFVKSVGNPLYVLVALAVIRWLTWRRDELRYLRGLVRRLPDPYRAYLFWVGLPIAVWMINPNNLRTFFLVVVNEAPTERPDFLTTLLYYPRIILDDYVGHRPAGILICLAAVLPLVWWKRLSSGQRFLYLLSGIAFFLCAIHQNTSPRYVFPLVPLIFLGASLVWDLRLPKQGSLARRALPCLAVVSLFWLYGRSIETPSRLFVDKTSEPGLGQVVDKVCEHVRLASGKTTLVGFWDQLPPGLVQWRCRQLGVPMANIPQTPNRLGLDFYAPHFERFLADPELSQVLVANYRTDPPQTYLMHYRNQWLLPMLPELPKNGFKTVAKDSFESPWYELTLHQRGVPEP